MPTEKHLIVTEDKEIEWTKHPDEEIDLDGMDLNDLYGTNWYNKIGWAKEGNTCLNKADYIDALGLFIFRVGTDETCQLIFDNEGDYSYTRVFRNGEWTNWEIFKPIPDPLTYMPRRDIESGVIEPNGDREVTFSTPYTETPSVFLTPLGSSSVYIESITTTGFTVSSTATTVQWLAVERD